MEFIDNEHLSADTLFNFTKEFKYIEDKIRNRFKPRLVLEDYTPIGIQMEIAIPMVCFCDIRLSDIWAHTKEYGDYGIGLKKEWGIEKELSPLIYVSKHAALLKHFANSVTKEKKEHVAKLFINLKPYSGKQNGKNRNFYNEREWRFIPNAAIVETFFGKKEIDTMHDPIHKNEIMKLDLSQVEYIIIEKESDFNTMIGVLKRIANPQATFETLISKIITAKQIEKDF